MVGQRNHGQRSAWIKQAPKDLTVTGVVGHTLRRDSRLIKI